MAKIDANTFTDLDKITHMMLDMNAITDLPDTLFYGLYNLIEINLAFNNLTYIPANFFSNLTVLTSLNLKSNRILALNAGIFQGFFFLVNSIKQLVRFNNFIFLKTCLA